MSEFLIPCLQSAGVLAAGVVGFLALEYGLRTAADRLTADRSR